MSTVARLRSRRGGSPFSRLESLVPDGEGIHPAGPRNALFFTTLALLAFGMLIQLSHASTTLPAAETGEVPAEC